MIKRAVRNVWRLISPSTRAKLVRATQDQFTVSTAAIVINDKNEILLLNHVLRPNSGWGFPGGFVEHGEAIEDAIRREANEETGIELENLQLLEINTFKRHVEILWTANSKGNPQVQSAEILELGWFSLLEITPLIGRNQIRQVQSAIKGREKSD